MYFSCALNGTDVDGELSSSKADRILHPILTEAVKTKSYEELPTPLPAVQSAAFNSSNLRTTTMLILLSGTPPVEEYLYMMTKLGSRDFLVNFDRLQKSTLSKL